MKNKGGRGLKNEYTTVVMRVPVPLKGKFEALISEFYESQKPVTSIKVIEDSEINKPVTSIEDDNNKPVTSIEDDNNKPVTGNYPTKTKLSILRLEDKLVNTLKENKIRTVEQLEESIDSGELKKIRGIGDVTISGIKDAILIKKYQITEKIKFSDRATVEI